MTNFDRALKVVLHHEGTYSHHPSDPGGETMYGITRRVAVENGYTGDMRQIPLSLVEKIYREKYWNSLYWDELPFVVSVNVFDGAVNSGVSRSVRWLQDCVGATVDGRYGPKTHAAVMSADPHQVAMKYNGIRLSFLTRLGTWPTFGRGWASRIAYNLSI